MTSTDQGDSARDDLRGPSDAEEGETVAATTPSESVGKCLWCGKVREDPAPEPPVQVIVYVSGADDASCLRQLKTDLWRSLDQYYDGGLPATSLHAGVAVIVRRRAVTLSEYHKQLQAWQPGQATS